jgi:hypothetical protein
MALPKVAMSGYHAAMRLRAADVHAEAGDHLVKDQQRPVPVAELAQRRQIAVVGRQTAAVAQVRLGDDRRDLSLMLGEGLFHRLDRVPAGHDEVVGRIGRLSARAGGRDARFALLGGGLVAPQHRVQPAVVVAFKLENFQRPPRLRARQPQRKLHAFAAAGGVGGKVGAWHEALDRLADLVLEIMLGAVVVRFAGGFDHRRHQRWVTVAQDHRPPGERVVDVFVAVHVSQARALTVLEVQRHRRLGPKRAAHASRQ